MAVGDHLVVDFGWYRHHGIDIGDGNVVHFGRGLHDIENAVIEMVSREVFSKGQPISLGKSECLFSAEQVATRALSRLGERGYDLIDNNCEHFAYWCRMGESRSPQASIVETGIRQTAAAAAKPILWRSILLLARRATTRMNRVPGKKLAGGAPNGFPAAFFAADVAQAAAETLAAARGNSPRTTRRIGAGTGVTVSAVAGWLTAGRRGSVTGIAVWALGQVAGQVALNLGKRKTRD